MKVRKLQLHSFFLCAVISTSLFAQASTQATFRVEWVGQFSTSDDLKQEKSITKNIVHFFFGKDSYALIKPVQLVVLKASKYFLLDQGTRDVVLFDFDRKRFTTIHADNYEHFPSLVGICADPDGNIYFSDSKLNRIFRLRKNAKKAHEFHHGTDLQRPTGIAYCANLKQIWISETAAHRLLVFDLSGKRIRQIGRRGKAEGEFNFPTHLSIDQQGFVYVVDSMNFRVQIFTQDGKFLKMFGQAGDATGYFARPKSVATDSFGHIYVVDALFHVVQIFDRNGEFLDYFGGPGSKKGDFWLPSGIFIAKDNSIYVADSYNRRIQIFKLVVKNSDDID